MKKKKIALFGLTAAVACLALASCDDDTPNPDNGGNKGDNTHTYVAAPEDVKYDTDGGRVDININYSGESGITYRNSTSYPNLVDGKTYTQGTLLPVWREIAAKTKTNINEASEYTTADSKATYGKVKPTDFSSETDPNQKIDLILLASAEIAEMGSSNKAVNLMEHLDKMPYFKAWLEKYPSQAAAIITNYKQENQSLYYTPYYEGQNNIERTLVMDTQLVEKVLDNASANYDTTTVNGGANPSKNVVQSGSYKPFMDATNNYSGAVTLNVLDDSNAIVNVQPKLVKNIIAQQNELLANGCTGKQLAEQFTKYLSDTYGDYIGSGKVYEKNSELFTSKKALYNVDELIGLIRVIKANPGLISGDATQEIVTIFPRGEANNRVDCMARLAQLWGVQGVTSSKDWLYFDANGKMHDAQTTKSTYDALHYLSQLYDEGLILKEFWNKPETADQARYLNRYYLKTEDGAGYGFLCWDFVAATSNGNDIEEGIGTLANKRLIQYSSKGIRPVLPPFTYWATEKNWDHTQDLTNRTGKTLTRYVEKNTALKSGSWVIPSTSDNIDGALRIMDYMFSPMGSYIQSFGPQEYWARPEGATTGMLSSDLLGANSNTDWDNLTPVFSLQTKAMLVNSGKVFYNFMRDILGATHGIGHIRSKGCDLQAINMYGQTGLSNLLAAIGRGVVVKNNTDPEGSNGKYTWNMTVPVMGSYTDTAKDYEALSAFWPTHCCAKSANGWVKLIAEKSTTDLTNVNISIIGTAQYTYQDTLNAFSKKDKNYLYHMATVMSINGNNCIPDYALSN